MNKETPLINAILAEYGARPDARLWRNVTSHAYVGKVVERERNKVTLWPSQHIQVGLCPGSSDIIGIGPEGRFVALEVKTANVRVTKVQKNFIDMVKDLGGVSGVVRSVEDSLGLLPS